jgi:hypothetical protein
MRLMCLAILVPALLATPAAAEIRTFIIANNPGGYGIDRCLSGGDACGRPVATAYCQSQSFAAAFRKIERDEITGAVPTGRTCQGGSCDEFVAIECSR